jgi:DNA-binding HxlR family transcriptional regulator
MRWDELEREACSLARTLSIIGDRWTLMILRDSFLRVRRFEDFESRLGIARPILADRLQKLVANFILTKVGYQENPVRYEYRLTPKGMDLYPIIMTIIHFGDTHLTGKKGRPVLYRHTTCGHLFDARLACSECGDLISPREVEPIEGPGAGAGLLPWVAAKPSKKKRAKPQT